MRSGILMESAPGTYPPYGMPDDLFLKSESVRNEDKKLRDEYGTDVRKEFRHFISEQISAEKQARKLVSGTK
jgi:hypothetical protein